MAADDPNARFRERRRQARRRQRLTRAAVFLVLLAAAAAVALGARAFDGSDGKAEPAKRADRAPARPRRQAAPNPYGSGAVGSKYQGQQGPTPSRYWQSFRRHAESPERGGAEGDTSRRNVAERVLR